jgi:hypothetical protein
MHIMHSKLLTNLCRILSLPSPSERWAWFGCTERRRTRRSAALGIQAILVVRRIIPLHQQPAAVPLMLPWVRDEDRFNEDPALPRFDAPGGTDW